MSKSIEPTTAEIATPLPGDDIVRNAQIIMDRAFTLPGLPHTVWPWFVQLGKNRAGWYLPRSIERFLPKKKRALRYIESALQDVYPGKIIDDWGGRHETLEVAKLAPPHALVYISKRGQTCISWAIVLRPQNGHYTRVQLRLRLSSIKHVWLAKTAGELIDRLTVTGLAAGLRQRLTNSI